MTASPSDLHIGLVVEGRGDVAAVPILLRRRLHQREIFDDILGKPVNCNGRDKALMHRGLEGFIAVAAARPGCRAVLVVLDGEGDRVCELGPKLLARGAKTSAVQVTICLAENNYEDWLFASTETLEIGTGPYTRSKNGLGAIVTALKPAKYVKPTWQPRLTQRVDIDLARRRNASLRRALKCFDSMTDDILEEIREDAEH